MSKIITECPNCLETLEHHEEVTVRRQINRVTAEGVLQFYDDTETFDDSGMNERLGCPRCLLTLPLPDEVEYI